MTMRQYLIDTVMISVQKTSDSTPSALCGVKCPPAACTTVCRVYKGLVPRSPNTTPSAPNAAHSEGRPRRADAPLESDVVIAPPRCQGVHVTWVGFLRQP